MLLWLMVDNYETMIVYLLYVVGYSSVVLFQVSHFSSPIYVRLRRDPRAHISLIVQPLLHQTRPGPCYESLRLCFGWSLCRLRPPRNPLDFNDPLHRCPCHGHGLIERGDRHLDMGVDRIQAFRFSYTGCSVIGS